MAQYIFSLNKSVEFEYSCVSDTVASVLLVLTYLELTVVLQSWHSIGKIRKLIQILMSCLDTIIYGILTTSKKLHFIATY